MHIGDGQYSGSVGTLYHESPKTTTASAVGNPRRGGGMCLFWLLSISRMPFLHKSHAPSVCMSLDRQTNSFLRGIL